MWFGFGLITAILAFVLAMRMRRQANWGGDTRWLDDQGRQTYEYDVVTSKDGAVTKVRMGVSAPRGLQFRVREEGKHDAFFKWLGICEEMETADAAFDERLYLESDAIAICYVLQRQASLRESILRIFDAARGLDLKRLQLRCMGGRLWVEFKPGGGGCAAAAPRIVPELVTVAGALQHRRLDADNAHDPFIWRAAALLSASTATAVLGGLG
jgi:hypothetical protein